MRGLVVGDDARVASWAFSTYNYLPTLYDAAVGIVDENATLVGAILFQAYNGNDVQVSYYGKSTLSAGILRAVARILIGRFDVSRVTVVTDKNRRNLIFALKKIGFEIEGIMKRYYGKTDASRHAATRLVMYRERIDQIARVNTIQTGARQDAQYASSGIQPRLH